MESLYRIIDANLNRISEGTRVLEDVARFCFDNIQVSGQLKKLRHNVRKSLNIDYFICLEKRDSQNDIGPAVSTKLNVENKSDITEMVSANFKRIQEGLRSVEESLKVLGYDHESKIFESLRYTSYTIEKDFGRLLIIPSKRLKLDTDLYCITSEEHSNGRDNIEIVKLMIEAGAKIIQYREKDKTMLEKYQQCVKIRELTRNADVTFIVNDHIDLALSVEADGIHLGQDDLPISLVRSMVGERFIIGLSTHSPQQALKALENGADYIGVGPIFRTQTKKDVCDPVGLPYLDFVVKNIDLPFVAIGGIKLHNIDEVIQKGAKCIALVTEVVGSDDVKSMITNIKTKINKI